MQLLTPSGYKNIEDVNIGDELIAYDINTGAIIINTLLGKELWTHNMLPENPSSYDEETETTYDGMTSEEVFQDTYGDWKFYEINGTWKLYKDQSIWCNMKLVHVSDLQIGDVVYDDEDNDIVITSIVECVEPSWWRLTVSGDKSYIADNIQLHNASRFWQKQSASFNWNVTGPTNWGSASGVSDNASIPVSVDDVFFDGVGVNGNINTTVSGNITVRSVTFSAGYTAVATINAATLLTIAGNFTDNSAHTWVVGNVTTSRIDISAASTITTNGRSFPGTVSFFNTNTKTIVGNFTILGRLSLDSGTAIATTINRTTTEEIICNGFLLGFNNSCLGTITLRITGGILSFQGGGLSGIYTTMLIDGNISVSSGDLRYGGPLLRWVSGTFPIATSGLAALGVSTTFETNPIVFSNFSMSVGSTITLNSTLIAAGSFVAGSGGTPLTFIGAAGFDIGTFTPSSTGAPLVLKNGNTYIIRNITGGIGSAGPIQSDSLTLRANLILPQGGTCNTRVNFTRINATGGRTINTWNGVVTDCINVRSYTGLQGVTNAVIS